MVVSLSPDIHKLQSRFFEVLIFHNLISLEVFFFRVNLSKIFIISLFITNITVHLAAVRV